MIKKKINPECGKRLSECRSEKHITQEQLAENTGYSIQHISYIECGKRNLSQEAAKSFSKFLNVRAEYLMCEDNCKTIEEFADNLINKGPLAALLNILDLEVISYEVKPQNKELTPEDKAAYNKKMQKLHAVIDEIREFALFKLQQLNKEDEK
ncbi:helix-turn-helix domain-containing protein [Blautia sp. AF19-34]|nr:helix-turn-helix domain-containing protein [Blautia sp. AF19-34]